MRVLEMAAPALDASATEIVDRAPPTPGPGQVSIDVAFAGVNFIDVMARRGDAGYASGWPYVPGLEVVGTVRAVGDGVTEPRVGDRVAAGTAGGGFAEVAVVPSALAIAVPDAVASEQAAAAPLVFSTAVLLLEEVVRLRPGESVLMHSAGGGVGSAVAQVAAVVADAPRIGVVGEASRSDAAARAGWNHVVTTGAGPAAVRELLPEGVDAVLDPTGTVNLDFDLEVAAPGARVVLFGNPAGGAPPPLPPVGRLIGGNVGLFGFSISSLRRTRPTAVAAALQRSLALLAIGAVALDVTVVTGLDAVPDVHDALASRRGTGKYVARLT